MEYENWIHDTCEEESQTFVSFIECDNCIDRVRDPRHGGIYDCRCQENHIARNICKKCEKIMQRVIQLQEELDELVFELSSAIKKYTDCRNILSTIEEKSILSRKLRRHILEKTNHF